MNIFLRNLVKFVKSTNIIQEYMQHKFKRKMGILFWEFEEGMSIIKGVGLWPSQYLSNLKAFPLALLQPQCERARTLFKLLHISEVSLFWLNQSRPINDKWYWARINYLSITALVAVAAKAQTAFAEKFGTFYWALNTLNVRIYLQIRAKAMFFAVIFEVHE